MWVVVCISCQYGPMVSAYCRIREATPDSSLRKEGSLCISLRWVPSDERHVTCGRCSIIVETVNE